MPGRRYSREIALKTLFHLEFNPEPVEEAVDKLKLLHNWNDRHIEYALKILNLVQEHKREIDTYISKASKNWKLERIGKVERCILRLSSAELLYLNHEVPPKVCIDEAVEMAKTFGNEDASKFVNGIMDYIYKNVYAELNRVEISGVEMGGMDEVQSGRN